MGEQAEMIIDGTLCGDCGVFIGKQDIGAPDLCSDCKAWHLPQSTPTARKKGETRKVQCPHCERICKKGQSITDHMRDVHGIVNGKPHKDLKAENERLRKALELIGGGLLFYRPQGPLETVVVLNREIEGIRKHANKALEGVKNGEA